MFVFLQAPIYFWKFNKGMLNKKQKKIFHIEMLARYTDNYS